MKRIGFLYEQLLNKELLRQAFLNASKGKRNKRSVKYYLVDIDKNIDVLYNQLKDGTLVLSRGYEKSIYEKCANKTRDILVPKFFPDQVVHWAFCMVMKPIFMKGMYKWNCGSIPDRGIFYGFKKTKKELDKTKNKYILKTDFKKYYSSINTVKLMELLERKIKDKKMLNLAQMIIDSGGPGLPIGYYTSQWFANFYLERIDHYIKEELKVPCYIRYIDDLVFMGSNKKKLHKVRKQLEKKLNQENYSLTIKPNWQLWRKDSRPLNFLGFKTKGNQVRLRPRSWFTLNRFVKNIKKNGNCTVSKAQSYISRLGWLFRSSNGIRYYVNNFEHILSKGLACSIISNESKLIKQGV